ncbi:MAG: sigma 54-interacting transcriptional regulator [Myxococcota bacterium]
MKSGERNVLIIDDEPLLTGLLTMTLQQEGYRVSVSHLGAGGLALVQAGFSGVILLDIHLPDVDGLELLEPLLQASPSSRVIVMTGDGSLEVALESTRRGGYDFLTKVDDVAGRTVVSVKNAFRDRDMARRVTTLEEAVSTRQSFGGLIGCSGAMNRLFDVLRHALDSRVTVLIEGESGTGKELVCRALHDESPRAGGPFVAVNCAGIPESLLESELFGHERGAFTGAVATKKGKVELADGGTLFLDEIGEMPLHLQARILRVLETRAIERVGGVKTIPVDVRVVSATNRDLQAMVREGAFRDDLFYRLAVFPIVLPPLRAREGDVPLLADHFLRLSAVEEGKGINGFSPQAMQLLEAHGYPGNVRELQNIIRRAVVVGSGPKLTVDDLPATLRTGDTASLTAWSRDEGQSHQTLEAALRSLFPDAGGLPTLDTMELELIRRALSVHDGNRARAAKSLGISRATLYRRLQRLEPDGGEAGAEDGPEPGSPAT